MADEAFLEARSFTSRAAVYADAETAAAVKTAPTGSPLARPPPGMRPARRRPRPGHQRPQGPCDDGGEEPGVVTPPTKLVDYELTT